MTREIKFRGRRPNGKFVYGWLTKKFFKDLNEERWVIVTGKSQRTNYYVVDPDSVAQLVGRDCDGNEFYEGDKFIDSKGNEYIASLESMKRRTTFGVYEFWSGRLKLKEAKS